MDLTIWFNLVSNFAPILTQSLSTVAPCLAFQGQAIKLKLYIIKAPLTNWLEEEGNCARRGGKE